MFLAFLCALCGSAVQKDNFFSYYRPVRRFAYIAAGLFLIVQSLYVTARLLRANSMLVLAGASPALLAAFALGWLLVLRNLKNEPPTTPEGDS